MTSLSLHLAILLGSKSLNLKGKRGLVGEGTFEIQSLCCKLGCSSGKHSLSD